MDTNNLVTLDIPYLDFAAEDGTGYLRVHRAMASATRLFFTALRDWRFPIFSMVLAPVGGRQARLFNTIGFVDKKRVGGGSPSHHSYGLAFDLNPALNPLVRPLAGSIPPFAVYDPKVPGTVTPEIAAFARMNGFVWGGDWRDK
jgi:hypothetical protein